MKAIHLTAYGNPAQSLQMVEVPEHARLVAPDFNIFSILRLKTQEAAHSNFLGELLDPRGMHGQGTLFFEVFSVASFSFTDAVGWATGATFDSIFSVMRGLR